VPEMAVTASILIRFCATIDSAAVCGPTFEFLSAFLLFGRCDVVLTGIASSRIRISLIPTRSPVEIAPI
jgi:hypothetical protein